MSGLYTIGIVLILLLIVAVIVFYGYRLAQTQKSRDTTDERLRALMDGSAALRGRAPAPRSRGPRPAAGRRRERRRR